MINLSPRQCSSEFLRQFFIFCQKLRHERITVTLAQEIDTCRSLEHIDVFNYNDFYHSLRANLISRKEDLQIFDKIFFSHWVKNIEEKKLVLGGKSEKKPQDENSLLPKEGKTTRITHSYLSESDLDEDVETIKTSVYSPVERLQEKDFSTFSDEDLEEIKKRIALIIRKVRFRESRRKKAVNQARFFDFRKTIRKNIRYGGDIRILAWKKKKIAKIRMVLICDVSGSMERYSRFSIQFLYGLQNLFDPVETFVFSTRLSRITPLLRREGFEKALDKVSRTVLDWSGGTNIGECLGAFNSQYASRLLYRKTIVILISDGWDRGGEKIMREQMKLLRKRAYYILWLNPLLGSPQYKPVCIGMKTALPFLDQFLPFHNLDSLIKLGQTICRIS